MEKTKNNLEKDPVRFKHVDEVLKMMAAITHDDRFIEAANGEGGKPENMEKVLDRLVEKGRQEGRQEGRLEGKLEGRLEGRQEILASLVQEGILTLADAAKRAGLSPADFQAMTSGMK